MQRLASILLIAVAGLLCLGIGPIAVAIGADPGPSGLLLVVAPPWGAGVEGLALAAHGRVVGVTARPWSAVVADASPDALRRAGAWMILDARATGLLCGEGDPE